MACEDFTAKDWIIMQTQGRIEAPFVPGNVVRITVPRAAGYTVTVCDGTHVLGTYPDFICSGNQLSGKADGNELLLTIVPGPGRASINGLWNPTQATTGTWTGEEGGGGGRGETY